MNDQEKQLYIKKLRISKFRIMRDLLKERCSPNAQELIQLKIYLEYHTRFSISFHQGLHQFGRQRKIWDEFITAEFDNLKNKYEYL